jgi:parvulin-like peptidyl-prolyl isomerase
MKRLIPYLILAASPAALAASPEDWPGPGGKVVDRIEGLVNHEPITKYEVDRGAAPFVAKLMADTRGAATKAQIGEVQCEVIQSLVNDQLIFAEAEKLKLEVDQAQVDAQLARIKESNAMGDSELERAVRDLGFESVAEYRGFLGRELLKRQAVGIRVTSRVRIEDAEVERLYLAESGSGQQIEERRAAHILLKIPENAANALIGQITAQILAIRADAIDGRETFEELARRHSQDSNAQAGGDLGWFTKGDLDPDFEAEAFKLEEGQVSEPVRTDFGLHLLKLTGKRMSGLSDEATKKKLIRQIRYREQEKETERLFKEWVQELRAGAFVEIKLEACSARGPVRP